MRGGDGASSDVPIAPRDASEGRVSGLVLNTSMVLLQMVIKLSPKMLFLRSGQKDRGSWCASFPFRQGGDV